MATIPVIKAMATAFLVLLHQQCARMMTSVVSEKDIRAYLSAFEENELQDDIDGVGASQGRQMIPMEERFWERVGRLMPSANFKTLFRCTRPTFAKLVKALYGTTGMRRADGGRGPEFNPCERTAMALYRLGHGAGVRATAALFGVSDGWVSNQTSDVIARVIDKLIPAFLSWPKKNDQDNISAAFERRTGFRDAGFAMDGSHIPIPAPPGRDMAAYFNYKGFYSVILLAIVDNAGLFRWICVGPPGSSGDAGVWKWCKLSKEIVADQLLPELHRKIIFRGRYILGDSAFANSDWLLTPFDAPSTRFQRFFNYKHSQTRFIVEHAFGRLKWKFMCLKNRMYFKIEKVPGVVQTCVALYNFILVHEGVGKNEAFVDDHKTRRSRGSRSTQSAAEAGGSRDRECAYLAGKFLLETWGAEGSALDRARLSAERRHRQCPNEECAEGEPVVLPC